MEVEGPHFGEYVAACATDRCGYLGAYILSMSDVSVIESHCYPLSFLRKHLQGDGPFCRTVPNSRYSVT